MTLPSPSAPNPRLIYLDGLRGWMSLIVVINHPFVSFLISPGQLEHVGAGWLIDVFRWSPLGVAMDGMQAVYVFFTVSGIALTYPILRARQPDRMLVGMAVTPLSPSRSAHPSLGADRLGAAGYRQYDQHRGVSTQCGARLVLNDLRLPHRNTSRHAKILAVGRLRLRAIAGIVEQRPLDHAGRTVRLLPAFSSCWPSCAGAGCG